MEIDGQEEMASSTSTFLIFFLFLNTFNLFWSGRPRVYKDLVSLEVPFMQDSHLSVDFLSKGFCTDKEKSISIIQKILLLLGMKSESFLRAHTASEGAV